MHPPRAHNWGISVIISGEFPVIDDMPEDVELATSTWNAVSHAMEALGRLRQACCQLPSPRLLITPALAQEAVTTSALEGTYGALPELLGARLPQAQMFVTSPEIKEIRAYERMAHAGVRLDKGTPHHHGHAE